MSSGLSEVKANLVLKDVEIVFVVDVFSVEIVEVLAFLEFKAVLLRHLFQLIDKHEVLWDVFDNFLFLQNYPPTHKAVCQVESVRMPEGAFILRH